MSGGTEFGSVVTLAAAVYEKGPKEPRCKRTEEEIKGKRDLYLSSTSSVPGSALYVLSQILTTLPGKYF